MKKKGNISIKAKLLGIIIPVVIAIILILVFTALSVSVHTDPAPPVRFHPG